MRPRLYTIPADRPFLATLAAGLLRMTGEDPLLLARAVVLLPTRRAARSLSCRRARERRGRAAAAAAAAARDRRSRGRRDRADRRRRHGAAGAFRIAPAPAADPAGAEMGRTARP